MELIIKKCSYCSSDSLTGSPTPGPTKPTRSPSAMPTCPCVDYTDDSICRGSTITCDPSRDCWIKASGAYACYGATINCPPSHNCRVDCTGYEACRATTINCPTNPTHERGDCTINCIGSVDMAQNMKKKKKKKKGPKIQRCVRAAGREIALSAHLSR